MSPVLFALMLALQTIGGSPPLPPPPPPIPPGPVIFEIGPDLEQKGAEIHGSKFGSIAALQKAISQALKDCAREVADQKAKAQLGGGASKIGASPAPTAPAITEVIADGVLRRKTLDAVAQLLQCPIAQRIDPSSPLRKGSLSSDLWDILSKAAVPKPDVIERVRTLELALDGGETDYDRAAWQYGPPVPPNPQDKADHSDHAAVLTWGPFGATIGGGEVQAILHRLGPQLPEVARLLEKLDSPGVKQDGAFNALHAVYKNTQQRRQWIKDFATLGGTSASRAQYDEFFKQALAEPLGELYGLYAGAGGQVTEVDFAFFLDLATHLQITQQRLADASAALKKDPKKTPAARRRTVAEAMIADLPCSQRADQRKRNVAFYDELDLRQHFSDDEKLARNDAAWWARPSDCGLSDDRPFSQPFPKPAATPGTTR